MGKADIQGNQLLTSLSQVRFLRGPASFFLIPLKTSQHAGAVIVA
jgi:hypothetical protein